MKKVTVPDLLQFKRLGEKITMLTAYDYLMADLINQAQIDVVLLGDSVANVKLGYASTVPVTMEEILHHLKAVARVDLRALLVCDMPYLSYHVSVEDTLRNAGRLIKEGGAQMVKLEGGVEICDKVQALVAAHIPVMGHLGLMPQSINQLGAYKVQGKEKKDAEHILSNARALQDSGASAIVLECIPEDLARHITESLNIPVIGIGAGPHCDGQVLVSDDLLGLTPLPRPSFVKPVANLRQSALDAFVAFRKSVKQK